MTNDPDPADLLQSGGVHIHPHMAVALELIMGPLSDRFGRRPIVMVSLATFTVGSIGCAIASDIWIFLAFRLLQAAITSCYPISMAIIRDTAGKEQTASRIGYAAMILGAGPDGRPGTWWCGG